MATIMESIDLENPSKIWPVSGHLCLEESRYTVHVLPGNPLSKEFIIKVTFIEEPINARLWEA